MAAEYDLSKRISSISEYTNKNKRYTYPMQQALMFRYNKQGHFTLAVKVASNFVKKRFI